MQQLKIIQEQLRSVEGVRKDVDGLKATVQAINTTLELTAQQLKAKTAEAALTGKRIDKDAAAQAARAALDSATPLAKNAYKLPLFETLVRRAILKAVA